MDAAQPIDQGGCLVLKILKYIFTSQNVVRIAREKWRQIQSNPMEPSIADLKADLARIKAQDLGLEPDMDMKSLVCDCFQSPSCADQCKLC